MAEGAGNDRGEYGAVTETHSSVLFFVGDRVHKMKKPLDLGFLDNRTREARERICHREVELNRRLAPDVYLGVADLHGPDGEVCEHFVVMRRLPDDRRLAAAVERGEDVSGVIDDVAGQLAALHETSSRTDDIDRCAGAAFVENLWTLSLDHLAQLTVGKENVRSVDRIRTASRRYIAGRGALFAERIAEGRAVDGHGDLLADDIFCLDEGARIIDCLEFDDELRFGDGALDLAFLAMDLDRLGAEDAARRLIRSYADASGDRPPTSLVHHYIAYRALVRAKVSALRYEQGEPSAYAAAGRFLEQIERHLDRGRVRMVMVGGVTATGKSTLSRAVAAHLGAAVLRSDVIRKELAGLHPTDRAGAGIGSDLYSPEHTEATYSEMLARAETALARGQSVVLDATWTSDRHRRAARALAERTVAEPVEIECSAPRDVLVERIAARAARGDDPSDATVEVLDLQLGRKDAWPQAIGVDTVGEFDREKLNAIVGAAPW